MRAAYARSPDRALALVLACGAPSCGPAVLYRRQPSTSETERRLVSNPSLPAGPRSQTEHFEWGDSIVVTSSSEERVRDCPTFDLRDYSYAPAACAYEGSRCEFVEGDVFVSCTCAPEPSTGRRWRCGSLVRP